MSCILFTNNSDTIMHKATFDDNLELNTTGSRLWNALNSSKKHLYAMASLIWKSIFAMY